jgi:general stress protein CsbA
MIEASTEIRLGEAIGPAPLAHARVFRHGWVAIILVVLLVAATLVFASTIGMLVTRVWPGFEQWTGLLNVIGLAAGLVWALQILDRRHKKGFLAGLRKIGSPELLATRFRFDAEGVAIDSARLSYRVGWDAVLFVLRAPEHMLLQVDTITFAVPLRAFDEGGEAGFVALVRGALAPEALARSELGA